MYVCLDLYHALVRNLAISSSVQLRLTFVLPLQKSTEFGYSRKDVLIIGASIFGGGFAMYYGLQAGGLSAGMAGNFVQLFVVLGLCIGWIGSYIFRVANKVSYAA